MKASTRLRLSLGLWGAIVALAAATQAVEIQGRIADSAGAPMAGVTVEFTGGLASAVTDGQGRYAVAVPCGVGEFQVTPWKAGFFFAPGTATVQVSGSGATANFVGTPARAAAAAGPPAVTITVWPASVALGAPVTVQWQLFNISSPSINRIEWFSDTDPSVIFRTNNTRKVGTTYWAWFNAPPVNCTVSFQVHVKFGSQELFSTYKTTVVGTGTNSMPTVAITSAPLGANVGEVITVKWTVVGGKPTVHNSIHYAQAQTDLDTLTGSFKSTAQVLNGVFTPPDTFTYATTIKVPTFTGGLFLRAHAQIGGLDYFSPLPDPIVLVPNPNNPIVIQNPTGDPTSTNLNTSGPAGTSQKQYGITVPGVLTVDCQFKVNIGAKGQYATKVRAAIEPVGDSVVQWQTPASVPAPWTAGPLGKPLTASATMGQALYDPIGDVFNIKAVFTNLPTHNSGFGFKKVFAQIVDGGKVLGNANTPIGVFYGRDDPNNPIGAKEAVPTTPNWFYYWKEGGVVGKSSGWKFDVAATFSFGFYDPLGTTLPSPDPANVYVGPFADATNIGPQTFFKRSGERITACGKGAGPKCTAEILAHLFRFKFYHDNFLVPSADDLDPYGDPDNDGVPNFLEEWDMGAATDPNDPDTYQVGFLWPTFASMGDQHLRGLRKQLDTGISTNLAADWSWPWKQYSNVPPTPGNAPTVTIAIQGLTTIQESNRDFTFIRFSRSGVTTNPLTVFFNIPRVGTDIAVVGQNVTVGLPLDASGQGRITILANSTFALLRVDVLQDTTKESPPLLDLNVNLVTPPTGTYIADPAANRVNVIVNDDL